MELNGTFHRLQNDKKEASAARSIKPNYKVQSSNKAASLRCNDIDCMFINCATDFRFYLLSCAMMEVQTVS
jgi:hypothetical protein